MKRPRPLLLGMLISLSIFVLAACVGDLNPDGGWSAPVVSGDHVYVGAKDGRITRLSLNNDGRFDTGWGFPALDADTLGPLYGTPRINGDRVFGAAYDCDNLDCDAQVYALSTDDASPIWPEGTFTLPTSIVGAVAVTDDTVLFGTAEINDELDTGEGEGYLYALDTDPDANPRVRWRFATDASIWGTPVVSGGVVYIGDLDGVLHAVSLGDSGGSAGQELWNFKAGGAIVAEPLIADGKIYFGDFSDTFYALDIAARESGVSSSSALGFGEWSFDSDGWFWATPLIHDNSLYVGTLNGNFYSLNPDTGAELWATPGKVDGQIVGKAAAFDEVGKGTAVAVPSGKDNIGVFSAVNGAELNGFASEGGVKSNLLVDGRFLYAHTMDDHLLKFNIADRKLFTCIDAENGAAC